MERMMYKIKQENEKAKREMLAEERKILGIRTPPRRRDPLRSLSPHKNLNPDLTRSKFYGNQSNR